MKRCNSCWTINADQVLKCSKCGADLKEQYTYICNNCGKVMNNNVSVCPKCGVKRYSSSKTLPKLPNTFLQIIKNNKILLCVTAITFIISLWCSHKYLLNSYKKQADEFYSKSTLPLITDIHEKIYKKQNRDIGFRRIEKRTSGATEPTSNASYPYEVSEGSEFEILNFVVPGNIGKTVKQQTVRLSNGEIVSIDADIYISFSDEQKVIDEKTYVKCKYWKNGSFKDVYLQTEDLKDITKTDKYWIQVIPYFYRQKLWVPIKSAYWEQTIGGNYYE